MAYSTDNPPKCLMSDIGNSGATIWTYRSTDGGATVDGDEYFTDAEDLGMKVGDIVFVTDSDTSQTTSHVVVTINANGSADLGDGITIGTSTSSD